MASVVFMRGVNVGGHRKFQPAALARQLADLDVVNVGAAGTFVVRNAIAESQLRAALLDRLTFETELMICPAHLVLNLIRGDTFSNGTVDRPDLKRFVTVMSKRPRTLPALPITQPDGDGWQVKIIDVRDRFVLSLWRRTNKTLVYPNEVVEKHFGVSSTTRSWNTIDTICKILSDPG